MRAAEAGLARRVSTVLQIWMEGKGQVCGDIIKVGTDNSLYMSHEIVKSYEADLGLQVSVLAKMSSGVAKGNLINPLNRIQANIHPPVFSSETLLNTEDVSKTGKTGFQIQLRALGEESWLAIII